MDARHRKLLRQIIIEHFNAEELRVLCDDLDIHYDDIPGEGISTKAGELIRYAIRHGRLERLVNEIREARPNVIIEFEPQRADNLRDRLQQELENELKDVFQEFNAQLDAYNLQLSQIHSELDEWKQLHNLTQQLQAPISICTGYSKVLVSMTETPESNPDYQEKVLYELSTNWESSKKILLELKILAYSVIWIKDPFDEMDSDDGIEPIWYSELKEKSSQINKYFRANKNKELPDLISEFSYIVDKWLTIADKRLLSIINQINRIPKPTPSWKK